MPAFNLPLPLPCLAVLLDQSAYRNDHHEGIGIADATRYSLHLERRSGRYWLKQRGGVLGGLIVFGPGSVDKGEVFR